MAPPPMPTLRSEDDDDAKPAETPSSSAARKMLPKLPVLKERETYASFRAKWGLDQEEADEQDNEAASELRSLSQLRSKGESDRFLDDFNYLVEGLDLEMPLSVRRSTAIEVLRRLCEPDTMRKLKATGFIEKVYLDFRRAEAGNGDRVLDSALIFLVALMSRDQRVAEALLRVDCTEVAARENAALDNATGSDMLAVTSRLLRRPWAVDEVGTRERPRGTSEADAKSLRSLRSVIDASPLKHDDTIVPSVMSLALLTLSIISSQPPRQLFSPQKHIALSGVLGSVANFLCDTGVSIKRRLKAYESGMDLPPVDDAVDVGCIDLALRTCEACLAADEESHFVLADNAERLLAWICELILFCTATLAHGASQPAQECLIGALKVLVELTSSTAEWNAALSGDARALWSLLVLVAPSRYEQAHVSDDATTFDILCLALSTLTNVCETSASAREHLRNFGTVLLSVGSDGELTGVESQTCRPLADRLASASTLACARTASERSRRYCVCTPTPCCQQPPARCVRITNLRAVSLTGAPTGREGVCAWLFGHLDRAVDARERRGPGTRPFSPERRPLKRRLLARRTLRACREPGSVRAAPRADRQARGRAGSSSSSRERAAKQSS